MYAFKRGQTSIVLRVKLLDSSATTGAGLTGLTSGSSGLIISTIADNEASATAYTVAGSTIESITTLGTYAAPTATKCRFKEVDSTNHKGVYEIQIADARFAVSSAKSLLVSIAGATNLAQCDVLVRLLDFDPYDAVRGGLTGIPNANAGASGGLPLSVDTSGRVDVLKINGTSQTARDIGASVLLSSGTGTGQLDFTSGVVKANVTQNAGSAITAASGVQEVKVASIANNAITAAAIATDAIDADALKTDAITEIQSGLSTLDAAGVRSAVGLASANLDTQIGTLSTFNPSTTVVEGTTTWRQSARLWNAALAGKSSGLDTSTATYRDLADSKDRIVAIVDAVGNRSGVTVDVS